MKALAILLIMTLQYSFGGWISSGKPAEGTAPKKEDIRGKPCPDPEKNQTLEDLQKATGCVPDKEKTKSTTK